MVPPHLVSTAGSHANAFGSCSPEDLVRQLTCKLLVGTQMEEDFIMANPEWVKELEIMTKTKVKAEIQALSSFGFQYLSEVYLPLKLQEGDWI